MDPIVALQAPTDLIVPCKPPTDLIVPCKPPTDLIVALQAPHRSNCTLQAPHRSNCTLQAPHRSNCTLQAPHRSKLPPPIHDASIALHFPSEGKVRAQPGIGQGTVLLEIQNYVTSGAEIVFLFQSTLERRGHNSSIQATSSVPIAMAVASLLPFPSFNAFIACGVDNKRSNSTTSNSLVYVHLCMLLYTDLSNLCY